MIDHEREVAMLLAPAHLIDPDVIQIAKTARIELVNADAGDDPPDGVPVDPHQPFHGALVSAGREPRDEALEVARELRSRPGERDPLGARSVLRAPQTPPAAVNLKPPSPQVQVPPDGVLRPGVLARPRRVLAQRADQPPATQRDANHHPVGLKPDVPDPHALQPQKPGKWALLVVWG